MARNRNRNVIRGTCLRDCSDRFWGADALSDLGVTDRRNRRDFAKCLPNPELKSRPAHIQRRLEPATRRFNKSD
jgi:hypothetical protein